MGPLTFGLLPGTGGGGNGNGARACPSAHQLTFVVPPKKADPPAPPAPPASDEPKQGFEARLAEALRDAQVKLLKVRRAGRAGAPLGRVELSRMHAANDLPGS